MTFIVTNGIIIWNKIIIFHCGSHNMNTTKKIARNTAIQLVGKVISTLLGLVAIAIMTRHLGVEKFGWYITATGFLQFIGIISDFGFVVVTSSMLSEPKYDRKKLLNTLFTWRFFTGLILNGLSPLIIWFFPYPIEVKMAVAILAISFFTISLNQVFIGFYQAKLKMIIQMTGEVLGRIILAGGLLLMMFNKSGFLPMMGVIAVSSIVYTFYLWLRSPGIKFGLDKQISKNIYKKMWPIALAIIFNAIYLQGDKVILPLYISQADMGLYGAAYRVLDIITQSTAMIMGIMLPLMAYAWSRNLMDEFKKRLQMSFDLIALVVFPMIAGIIALSTPIMKLIAGSEFANSGTILRLLSLAIIGIAFGMTFGHIALAINRQRQSMWIYISDAIISLIAYLIFIPLYGVWGAIGVSIFAELYAGIGLLILVSYYTKFWPSIIAFTKIVLSSAIMGYLVYLIPTPHVLVSILLGIIIYTILILSLQTISKKTISEIISTKK